jgi:NADH-quinone oxidoreductase subunit F
VAASDVEPKYVVCNADESEPGTFKDRLLLETDPFATIEATTIAGLTVGAERGYVYLRGEYPDAERILLAAIRRAEAAGLLGADVAGSGARFDIEVRRAGGAYICGEETALFNSIEGYRGEPRQKPPFPTEAGLFGKPTLVNNVETLANIPRIVLDGGAAFSAVGTAESTGTRLFCVTGHVAVPGVYEVALGTALGDVLTLAGGVDGHMRAVLIGGAAGTFVGPDRLDLPLAFETARLEGISLGSGAVIVMNDTTDFGAVVRRITRFFRDESCGQCVPCRVGTVRQEEAIVRITNGGSQGSGTDRRLLDEIDRTMRDASICGLGHTAGSAVRTALALGLIGAGSEA